MTEQAIALVTGANKGLGLETCRQLARRETTVADGGKGHKKGTGGCRPFEVRGPDGRDRFNWM